MSRRDIRERAAQRHVGGVYAVSNAGTKRLWIHQNARNDSAGNVQDVINWTTAIRESCRVIGQKAKPLLRVERRRSNPGVQAKQIGNRTGVFWTATWANWSAVL